MYYHIRFASVIFGLTYSYAFRSKWLTLIFVDCNRFFKGEINEVRIEWTLIGRFPPGGIFHVQRNFLLFKDQVTKSGRQNTKIIVQQGKFRTMENGVKLQLACKILAYVQKQDISWYHANCC